MFGIGLPEFILILALALIVVGPDKLPDLARSVAKGILDLKKTANTLKESLTEEGNPFDEIKPELEKAAKALSDDVLGNDTDEWSEKNRDKIYDPRSSDEEASSEIIDVEAEADEAHLAEAETAEPDQQEAAPKEVDNSKTVELETKRTEAEQKS